MSETGNNRSGASYRVFRMAQYGRPVLATPIAPLEARLAGLMRFQPTTRRKAVYRWVMQFLMRRGIDHWFARDTLSPLDPATGYDFNGWLEQARADVGDPRATASVIWPTEQRRMRVYVHLFDSKMRAIGFAKLSLSEENDRRLAHEAEVLDRLTAMGLKECHVPRVLANRQWQGRRYLILEPIPEEAGPLQATLEGYPRASVDEFDGPARFVPGDQFKGLSWWPRYESRLEPGHRQFADELENLARDGVWVRRAHGDFGRHNIVSVNGKPWVFDWEEACEDAPAATDEVVFWVTFHYRGVIANPRAFTRLFTQRFLRGASPQRLTEVMMVLAFRHSLGMASASAIMRNWARSGGGPGGAETYRRVFAPREKAEEYERSMCQSGSYAEVLWEVEKAQLAGVIADLRRTHGRIESLDFAAGTGRIARFVEGEVDSSTAIEISPAMIEVARQKVKKTTILCKDVTAPGAEIEGKYDLITAFRFVVNAEPSLRLAGLKALAARLRGPESVLVFNNHGNLLSHKMLLWPLHRLRRLGKAWTPDGNYMTDAQVRELADRAGLGIERVMGCGLLSGRGSRVLPFARAVAWESVLARWSWLSRFGGNQRYVARLKPAGSTGLAAERPAHLPLRRGIAGVGAPGDEDGTVPVEVPMAGARPEAHRAMVRIVTNYVRLGLNLALGLIFVPFVLHWVGSRALGLIILLGAGVGIASMFREITTRSVIRELGAAHHTGDEQHFRTIFNSSLVVSLAMAGIAGVLFVVLYLCLPLLNIPDEFDRAARVMVASQAIYIFITTALSPVFNMLVVTEKFVRYNLWILAERSTMLLTAVALFYLLGPTEVLDPVTQGLDRAATAARRAMALSDWSMVVAGLQCLTFLVPVGLVMISDRRLRPALSRATRPGVKVVGKTLSLYVAVETASMLYEKVGALIVNVFFGLPGNTVFGVAYQFVSYVRQATAGVTFGLDAVSARISTTGPKPLRALMHHSTRLHGLVAIPTGVAVFLLAEPLIRVWIGGRLRAPEEYLPGIILTVKIMSISMTARAIAEGWNMILYGAGFLRRYAPLVLTGGLIFPPLTVSLLRLCGAPANPSLTLFLVPATFCALQFTIYLLLLPGVAARCIGVRYGEMFIPLWRPVFATALAAVALVVLPSWLGRDPARPGPVALAVSGMVFGALYAVLAMWLVLTAPERERFVWGPLRRRFHRRGRALQVSR